MAPPAAPSPHASTAALLTLGFVALGALGACGPRNWSTERNEAPGTPIGTGRRSESRM